MKHFICHRDNMWEDSWTYGDWRQFLCKRPDNAIICARVSNLPPCLAIVAIVTLFVGIFDGTGLIVCASFALALFPIWLGLTANRLMVAVGPPQYEGIRIFNWEVKAA